MATIKKKDILEVKIEELINPDGSPIEGDETYNTTSQINVGVDKAGSGIPATIMDKSVHDRTQGNRYYLGPQGVSYPGAAFHKASVSADMGDDAGLYDDDAEIHESTESLDKIAKENMKKMVEDIVTKNLGTRDMVKKSNSPDITKNTPMNLSPILTRNITLANSVIDFVRELGNQPISDEEKQEVLSYISNSMNIAK